MSWKIIVILVCVLLFAFTAWLEYRRSNRRHLAWRIGVSLIAIAALGGIALPVMYNGSSRFNGEGDAVLLTEHFKAAGISHYGGQRVFTIDQAIKKVYSAAILLSNIQDIHTVEPRVKRLHILGYGLDDTDLQQLKDIAVIVDAPPVPMGLLAVNWASELNAGELLKVQGKFNNTSANPVKLILKGLNTTIDSALVPAGKNAGFAFTAAPKVTGRIVYNLLALDGRDTIENETVPVNIEPAQPVKILLLSSAPDFEVKFLKNWLSGNGYVVAVRTAISKGKISQDFVNTNKQSLEHLSSALLRPYDVVICDLPTLSALNSAEKVALQQQVQNGLGLIISADSAIKPAPWPQNNFRVTTLAAKGQPAVPLLLQNQKDMTQPLTIDLAYLSNSDDMQNLVTDRQHHILAGAILSGAGRIVCTTQHTTYAWLLTGDNSDYSAFWSLLIGKAARTSPPLQAWTVTSGIPVVNTPVQLLLQSGSVPTPVRINQALIAPVQSPSIPYAWNLTYWPQNFGWQQAVAGNNPAYWWYAYRESDWRPLKISRKLAETKKYAAKTIKAATVTKQIQNFEQIEVPKWIFYLILVAALTYLWVERKLAG
jgi:hypothetical protein